MQKNINKMILKKYLFFVKIYIGYDNEKKKEDGKIE